MNQPSPQALIRKALIIYAQKGETGLEAWRQSLPPDQLAQLEEHCAGPLNEAIAALAPILEGKRRQDPRRQYQVDKRRTKPL